MDTQQPLEVLLDCEAALLERVGISRSGIFATLDSNIDHLESFYTWSCDCWIGLYPDMVYARAEICLLCGAE